MLSPFVYKQYIVETQKDVSVYKGFVLRAITDVYEDINSGKEVYFLNAENKPIRVLSITKEPYSGKIYDVDVENDVVLVRRKSVPEFDYNNDTYKIILEDGSEG